MRLKHIKKYFRCFLALLLIIALTGCGEYRPANPNIPNSGSNGNNDNNHQSPPSEDLVNDPNAFTVALRFGGKLYVPKKSDGQIVAEWTDGYSVYTADFAKDGYARIAGLDGDYRVTLKGLPEKFVYNPNAYTATNDDRQVIIDIYLPQNTTGTGGGLYSYQGCISISKVGVYRIKIDSPEQIVYFEYGPQESGTYSVESWVSTSEGNYNPKVDVYNGWAAKYFAYTLDDGGYSKGYTQNFKHIVEIAEEQISEGGGGSAQFTFGIHCDSKNGVYPVYINFAVQLNGSFSLDHADKELIIPEIMLEHTPDYNSWEYEWTWAETETKGVEGRYQFDGDMFRLWSVEDGGDGYYHLYDETLYKGYTDPDGRVYADGYGPILYAKISQSHRFTEAPFISIEDAGNSSLTVYGNLNHKLFIEGIVGLLVDPGLTNPQATSGSYFCLRDCKCREDKTGIGVCGESCMKCEEGCRNLPDEIMEAMVRPYFCTKNCPCRKEAENDKTGAIIHLDVCKEGCTKCSEECSNIPADIYDNFISQWNRVFPYDLSRISSEYENFYLVEGTESGYAAVHKNLLGLDYFTNSDGVYGVTEQIKFFLQGFSITQRYFADGQGWVEAHPEHKVDAKEADQWLFACGYYIKN